MASPAMSPELANAIVASARRLGIDPVDLGTTISFETGGRMSPSIYGGKDGKYLGLIQFSPENQKKYGVTSDQSAPEQMQAVESYLRDRGVKPGMKLPDVYSAVNAGAPGRYNASDAANGGTPGTVMDKVTQQMGPHMFNVRQMLGLDPATPPQVGALGPNDANSGYSGALPVAPGGAPIDLMPSIGPGQPAVAPSMSDQLAAIGKSMQGQQTAPSAAAPPADPGFALSPINMPAALGQNPALALAQAMQRMRGG